MMMMMYVSRPDVAFDGLPSADYQSPIVDHLGFAFPPDSGESGSTTRSQRLGLLLQMFETSWY